MGTFGVLSYPKFDFWCFTCELPWLENSNDISCVPNGWHKLEQRESPLLTRLTKGKHKIAWDIVVVDRLYTMFHPANIPSQLDGCVAVGKKLFTYRREWGVSHSEETFEKLQGFLDQGDPEIIQISTEEVLFDGSGNPRTY